MPHVHSTGRARCRPDQPESWPRRAGRGRRTRSRTLRRSRTRSPRSVAGAELPDTRGELCDAAVGEGQTEDHGSRGPADQVGVDHAGTNVVPRSRRGPAARIGRDPTGARPPVTSGAGATSASRGRRLASISPPRVDGSDGPHARCWRPSGQGRIGQRRRWTGERCHTYDERRPLVREVGPAGPRERGGLVPALALALGRRGAGPRRVGDRALGGHRLRCGPTAAATARGDAAASAQLRGRWPGFGPAGRPRGGHPAGPAAREQIAQGGEPVALDDRDLGDLEAPARRRRRPGNP